MDNLLLERHPDIIDIGQSQVDKILKYTSLDANGNVIECLARNSVDEPFVDITDAEKTRKAIADYEKELSKLRRTAYRLKEEEPDYVKENNTTN